MIRFKGILAAVVALSLTGLCSCGYHLGSMMHPQVKSIAIAPVVNDTLEPLVSAIMRQQLAEQFQLDNSLKVKSLEEADCIIYCKVKEVKNVSVTWDSTDNDITYRPSEFTIEVKAEFSVIIPGRGEPLINAREITQSATYQFAADPAIGRSNGLKQACYNASRQMVQYTTEAW